MARSWWDFVAEWTGYEGGELSLWRITCGYCGETGHFTSVAEYAKTSETKRKSLHYDIYKCGDCGNLTRVFWATSAGGNIHDFRQVPWPKSSAMKARIRSPAQVEPIQRTPGTWSSFSAFC